jgi:hypothetical protein
VDLDRRVALAVGHHGHVVPAHAGRVAEGLDEGLLRGETGRHGAEGPPRATVPLFALGEQAGEHTRGARRGTFESGEIDDIHADADDHVVTRP